ncbi:hypothetical protein JVT61DRAFT_14120 [Boletus reticuloceps]|uniref:Uncharacterized protein n=1 Tax=Boletus reticuloceps TaxID=495285 RepID=A0A8I2YD44_9AGAM|nr:hypothetical protein JVT61DRAFT_14120 [Boletus reticuloceps]
MPFRPRTSEWTAKHGPYTIGDPDLHHYIGELLYKEEAYDAAELHLLASGKRDSARLLAQMMVDWCAAGGIPGNFALRGTLPYLENGNILAARTFIVQFVNKIIAAQSSLASSLEVSPLPVTDSSEVVLTTDNALNFCQLAVLACQRGNAEKNKVMRESWIRLCGTYQSRGGILATNEVRSVRLRSTLQTHTESTHGGSTGLGIARHRNVVLCPPTTQDTTEQPTGCDVVFDA